MVVKVIYFAEFRKVTGKDSEEFELKNNTIKELIHFLVQKYSKMQKLLWDKHSESINNNISIIVNNKPIHDTHNLSTFLKEGDEITFLLPISGG
ncbi:MAG: MoaD/ThiS family protein [Promethearchaeota archaeon]